MAHIFISHVTKSFGAFKALDNVSIDVSKGEIHAILGENGAGKSTLMNVLYGLYQPDAGTISLDGRPIRLQSPNEAIENGIGMIHQHFMLVPSLTVTENIILGLERGVHRIDLASHEARIADMGRSLGFEVEPRAPVWTLPMGMRQRVEILKTLYRKAEIVILDEPTSVLAPGEIDTFLAGIRKLREAGHTILFITHKLEEVMQVADRVTVMRNGKVVHETDAPKTTPRELARWMVGREVVIELRRHDERQQSQTDRPVLEADELVALSDRGVKALDRVALRVNEGEILGVTGVDGNGQKELGEVIAGLRALQSGRLLVEGRDITNFSVKARMTEARIAFVPEDRQAMGLVLDYSVAFNTALRSFDRPPASRRGILDFGAIRRRATELTRRYDVRLRSIDQQARFLSGGNQQKVILAREIEAEPRLLVVMQACKGLDVGAIEFVQNTILDLKTSGVAVLYIATELEHVLDVSDRIAVMYRGRITGTLPRSEATTQRIGELMAGIDSERAA